MYVGDTATISLDYHSQRGWGTPSDISITNTRDKGMFLLWTQTWALELDRVNLLFCLSQGAKLFSPLTVDDDVHVYTQWQRAKWSVLFHLELIGKVIESEATE